jgi:hypothetical protein
MLAKTHQFIACCKDSTILQKSETVHTCKLSKIFPRTSNVRSWSDDILTNASQVPWDTFYYKPAWVTLLMTRDVNVTWYLVVRSFMNEIFTIMNKVWAWANNYYYESFEKISSSTWLKMSFTSKPTFVGQNTLLRSLLRTELKTNDF